MPFAATWMDLEIIIQMKSERERQILYCITYMCNLQYDTNKLNISSRNRLADMVAAGEEWIESLGLADANYYI